MKGSRARTRATQTTKITSFFKSATRAGQDEVVEVVRRKRSAPGGAKKGAPVDFDLDNTSTSGDAHAHPDGAGNVAEASGWDHYERSHLHATDVAVLTKRKATKKRRRPAFLRRKKR